MRSFFFGHHNFWTERNKKSFYLGLLLLALSLVIQAGLGHYSARSATNFVGDIFLDNLPTVDLDFIIVQGSLLMLVIGILLVAQKPRYLLFAVKAVSLFIIVRAFFVSLTHIGIYPRQLAFDHSIGSGIYDLINFQANFFFSGHTGMPFLMALIFWPDKFWRWFFVSASVLFAASVLLAHVHYSIDVFAAPFMTYSIFKIAERLFPYDHSLMPRAASS